MDVISILRKSRQDVRRYEVDATGTQQDEHPNAFTRIDIVHVVEGSGIDIEAVRRAIELSATKYCSVGATLSSGLTEVHHAYIVRDDTADVEQTDEVIVIGPRREPSSLTRPPEDPRHRVSRGHGGANATVILSATSGPSRRGS